MIGIESRFSTLSLLLLAPKKFRQLLSKSKLVIDPENELKNGGSQIPFFEPL